ncbi:MAG: hypothetical protein LBH10_02230 [Burkholderiaceae bacterium]|nr:hypothetical protein [Burkholderiaceae bacterium]
MAAVQASWQGTGSYGGPNGRLDASWRAGAPLAALPLGLVPGAVAAPALRQTLTARPPGIAAPDVSVPWALLPEQYAPAQYQLSASWASAAPRAPALSPLSAGWGAALLSPGGVTPLTPGAPRLDQDFIAAPQGWDSLDAASPFCVHIAGQYIPAQYVLDASWTLAASYAAALSPLGASWGAALLSPSGAAAPAPGTARVSAPRRVTATGWDATAPGSNVYTLFWWQYAPPQWQLVASWVGAGAWSAPRPPVDATWAVAQPGVSIALTGWQDGAAGTPMLPVVQLAGVDALAASTGHALNNGAAQRNLQGFDAFSCGAALLYNLTQYVQPKNLSFDAYGVAALLGGLWPLAPTGLSTLAFGAIQALNTTADRAISPPGADNAAPGSPLIWPAITYPLGLCGTAIGTPAFQFPPYPAGWPSDGYGYPVIEYKTRVAAPPGLDAWGTGYPTARQRAQTVWNVALPDVAVFGDIQAQLRNLWLTAQGWDAQTVNVWTAFWTNTLWLSPPGLEPLLCGAAATGNVTPSLAPPGLDSASPGDTALGARVRSVAPPGAPQPYPQVSEPSLWHTPSLAPAGIAEPEPNPVQDIPTVWFSAREMPQTGGADTQRFGNTASVGFTWRELDASGAGIAPDAWGAPTLEFTVRGVTVIGPDSAGLGSLWASFRQRALAPGGMEPPPMTLHRIDDATQTVAPYGVDAAGYLSTLIIAPQYVIPIGLDTLWGMAGVWRLTQYAAPASLYDYDPAQAWGTARTWNLIQVIAQVEDQQSGLWPPPWTGWTAIANRNASIGALGYALTGWGYTQAANIARAVQPCGVAPLTLPEYQPCGSVTYRIRALPLDGLDGLYMTGWAVAYNSAVTAAPVDWEDAPGGATFGNADLVNLTRDYRLAGWDSFAPGAAYADYAIRAITLDTLHSIEPPVLVLPVVENWTQYLAPAGIFQTQWQSNMGVPDMSVFWQVLYPGSAISDLWGAPALRNKTPEQSIAGFDAPDWGNAAIRTQWRELPVDSGADAQQFGAALLHERTQTMLPASWQSMLVSGQLGVRRPGMAAIPTQTIDLNRYDTDPITGIETWNPVGYGAAPPAPGFGIPSLVARSIWADPDADMQLFGRPTVLANTIRVEPGIYLGDQTYGAPTVAGGLSAAQPQGWDQEDNNGINDGNDVSAQRPYTVGVPKLWPRTVYAVMEAPDQAVQNSPAQNGRPRTYVDDGSAYGTPSVFQGGTLNVGVAGWDNLNYNAQGNYTSALAVWNTRNWIIAEGMNLLGFGIHTLPFDHTALIDSLLDSAALGAATVAPPPYCGPLALVMSGLDASAFGAPDAQMLTGSEIFPGGEVRYLGIYGDVP